MNRYKRSQWFLHKIEHGQEQGANDDRVNFEDNQLENGKLKRVEYGYSNDKFNNVTSIKEYDFGQTDSSLLKLQYGYGTTANNGNVLTQTITIGTTVINQNYVYDELNRLQTAQENSGASWSQTYDYDRYGNRAVRNTSYMPSPQLTPQSASSTDFTAFDQSTNRLSQTKFPNVLYDGAGNLTRDIVASTFSYDGENRQVTSSVVGTTASYFYDGDGRRVKKVVGTVTTVFVYNVAGQLIAEYTTDPVPPPAGGGGTSYLTADHLGSTRVVTGSDGAVKARYDYLPFGEEIGAGIGNRSTFNGYSQADGLRQKFTSKERDSESGLDYFDARYYSSAQGRFTSPDEFVGGPHEFWLLGSGDGEKQALPYAEITDPQSLNKYQYALDNPFRYVDPDGHQSSVDLPHKFRQDLKRLGMSDEEADKWTKVYSEGMSLAGRAGAGLLAGALIVAVPKAAAAAMSWAARNPDKVEQIAEDLVQLSTGNPAPGPAGTLTIAAKTRLTAEEISTGARLAQKTGMALAESGHKGEEFFSIVNGVRKTYDTMGHPRAYQRGNMVEIINSIKDHLNKVVDYVVIDLKGASRDQRKAIRSFVRGLTEEQQKRIIYVK